MTIANYIEQIPELARLSRTPSKLIPYFALYIELEDTNAIITPKDVSRLFDEARVRGPINISDSIRRSRDFIRVKGGGYRLSHGAKERLASAVSEGKPKEQVSANADAGAEISNGRVHKQPMARSTRDVFVVHGRDHRLRRDLFSLLRAMGVNPLEFEEMAHLTGSTSPSTWEVIHAGFAHAQACVVLFSPDEKVTLREVLREEGDPDQPELQPRPNVLLETGMALALSPTRTILVRVGPVREVSDLHGMQYVNLTGSSESRNKLLNKLRLAGCDVKKHGDDWLSVGNFKLDVH